MALTRREFLAGASAISTLACAGPLGAAASTSPRLFSQMGIMAPLERAAELKACGCDYLIESVARVLVPDRPESEFGPWRDRVLAAELPVIGCNYFLRDPKLRSTGPDADHPRVLAFAEAAFRRLREIGGEYVVFGSCGSRRLPAGWPKEKADEQFVALLQAMGPLAARHNIMVAVEHLNQAECNYLIRLPEVISVIAAANHPNIRALADIYHLLKMGESPSKITQGMRWIAMVEIAEKDKRTVPGVAGDDFRPYFAALAAAGYRGRIGIEAHAGMETPNLKRAFETITLQAAEVLAKG